MESINRNIKRFVTVYCISFLISILMSIIRWDIAESHYILIGIMLTLLIDSPIETFFLWSMGWILKCPKIFTSNYIVVIELIIYNIINYKITEYLNSMPFESRFVISEKSIILSFYYSSTAILFYSFFVTFLLVLIIRLIFKSYCFCSKNE